MKKLMYVATGLVLIMAIGFSFQTATTGKKSKGGWAIDKKASELKWSAQTADNSGHGHTGTVQISEGTAKFNGKTFESASFKVDMKTIDSELTADGGEAGLLGHLATEDFFHTATFPSVDVKVTSWNENEMAATLTIVGKELKTTFPVKTTMTDDKMTVTGKFTLDVSSLGIPGFTPDPEKEKEKPGSYISPKLPFELNLVMTPSKK